MHVLRVAALAILVACAAACSRSDARESAPAIRLSTSGTGQAYIEVVGLSDSTLDRLADARYSRAGVVLSAPSVRGRRVSARGRPLRGDRAGASVHAALPVRWWTELSGSVRPRARGWRSCRLTRRHSRPRSDCRRRSGRSVHGRHARLSRAATCFRKTSCGCTSSSRRRWADEAASSTSRCSTSRAKRLKGRSCRWTTSSGTPIGRGSRVFFDPGRVKDGILPNKQMGPVLEAGRTYTLLVREDWQDTNGLPLKEHLPPFVPGRAGRHPTTGHRAMASRRSSRRWTRAAGRDVPRTARSRSALSRAWRQTRRRDRGR